jgi:hypothetical protein
MSKPNKVGKQQVNNLMRYVIGVVISIILFSQVANAQTDDQEFFIRISAVPSIVDITDSNPNFFVFIMDNLGSPMTAPRNLEVSLVASNSTVADVPSSIIIPEGSYYALGNIDTRDIGTTDISASYLGQRVSVEIEVTETSNATDELSLTVRTPAVSMLTGTSMPISVFLSDSEGNAIKAPADIAIKAEYDKNLISLDFPAKLEVGSTYAIGTVTSLQRSGNAWIRLHADEIGQQITTSVKVNTDKPKSLTLRALPGNVTVFDRAFYVYAGLLDETGAPTIAEENVTVHIFSNMTAYIVGRQILDEPPVLHIEKGKFGSFVKVQLELINTNSTSIFSISAAAEGLRPANTLLNLTNGVAKLSKPTNNMALDIETILDVGENSEVLAIVQMWNGTGTSNTTRALYSSLGTLAPDVFSSNMDALEVTNVGAFTGGSTYAIINLKTGFKSDGNVTLIGAIPGFLAGNTTINVVTKQPAKTVIFSPVNDIRFNKDDRSDLYVILLDDSDRVVKAERDVQFLLTPVNEVQSIRSGHSYAHFNFAVNRQLTQNDNATLVALPVGVDSDVGLESTLQLEVTEESAASVQIIPPFHDLIGVKSTLNMIVQLTDSIGNPYISPTDVSVTLSSSDSLIIDVEQKMKIPKGSSYALFPIYPRGNEGAAEITATAIGFEPSSTSIRSVLPPLPLTITPSLPAPETNREMKLIVISEPGAELTWELPANIKVVEMDEQVAVDGIAELVFIPLTAEEIIVDLEGSKAGYVRNKVSYDSMVSNVVQNMKVQLISYADTIVLGEPSTIEAKVTDEWGSPVEGVKLTWEVTDAEILSMSSQSDADGNATVEILTQDPKDIQVSVAATKNGFSEVSESTSLTADVSNPIPEKEEVKNNTLQGIPDWFMYVGLVGAVGAVASMRLVAMKKSSIKTIPGLQDHSQASQQPDHTENKVHKSLWKKFFKFKQ